MSMLLHHRAALGGAAGCLLIHAFAWLCTARADDAGDAAATAKFLEEHAPAAHRILQSLDSKLEGEDLEEARARGQELREIYLEAREEFDEEWAQAVLALEENEIQIEFLVWRFEEGEIGEGDGEERLINLLQKKIELQNRADRQEMRHFPAEAAKLREEIRWREANPEEVIKDWFIQALQDAGLAEEEEEEEEAALADQADAPIYTPPPAGAADPDGAALDGVAFDFDKQIAPTLERYCFDCHDRETAKGDIDLESALAQQPLVRHRALWENVAERIRSGDMPPEKKPQPAEADRLRLRAWLAREIDGFDYSKVRDPGYVPARRLTREEYNRTIRDLVGLDLRPADEFPMDFSGTSGFSNSSNTLFLQTAQLDRYFTAAENVIDSVRKDPSAWAELAGDPGGARSTLTNFLHRAFRRPPVEDELSAAIGRYESATAAGKSQGDALADEFKLALISPHFLLRTEQASPPGSDHPVGGYDLASRLSYFLWASAPDDGLLAAAAGDLRDPAERRRQIDRMLADPRSLALGEIFAAEWLSTDDVGPRIRKDPIDNPWCTESLMAAMRNETALFFHSLVIDNAPVARLIDAEYTYLNAELAEFYRIRGIEGEHMRRVALRTAQRGGLFGHASVLVTTSFPNRTSPVVRGKWILDTLLGTPPPPPPPDVPEIEVEGGNQRAARSLRRKLEIHRDSKKCASCHGQIDPLGFALESYAEFGQWRGGVDDRGTLPNGARFRGPAGLKLALIDTRLDDLGAQVTRKMLSYALGRQLEYYDEGVVREIAAKLKPGGYRLRDLVVEIAESHPFTTKRTPTPTDR